MNATGRKEHEACAERELAGMLEDFTVDKSI
jgi:hypothetical protein